MSAFHQIQWHDPRKKLWGFHIHQELPLEDFTSALVTQKYIKKFLNDKNILIDNDEVTKPGYGPHLDYTWELRVENVKNNLLEKMGLAIASMALNRFGLSAYIHPLMQDSSLPEEKALAMEGRDNEGNALWFTYRVSQNLDFFFNPPKDQHNKLLDTRTPRIMGKAEKAKLLSLGLNKLSTPVFNDPYQKIFSGFHIHMNFSEDKKLLALVILDEFIKFINEENIKPTSTSVYGPRQNGPHILGGWEIQFETKNKEILSKIGVAIGWLMCNRQELPIFIYPITWQAENHNEKLKAYTEYSFFIGEMPKLDLSFFHTNLANDTN